VSLHFRSFDYFNIFRFWQWFPWVLLELTPSLLRYILPRVIAMAIPGEGIEKNWRNNINDVSRFLNGKHGPDYRIFNLTGEEYGLLLALFIFLLSKTSFQSVVSFLAFICRPVSWYS
jgi:hypothetical protein